MSGDPWVNCNFFLYYMALNDCILYISPSGGWNHGQCFRWNHQIGHLNFQSKFICVEIGWCQELFSLLFLNQNNPKMWETDLMWKTLIGLGMSLAGAALFKSRRLGDRKAVVPIWRSSMDPWKQNLLRHRL